MLTVDGLRLHVTTSLGDEALQLLLDAAYEAIDARAGPTGQTTEVLRSGSGELLMLSRPAASIISITEGTTALATDDWSLSATGQLLRRLSTGTNPRSVWQPDVWVTITYALRVAEELRDQVAIGLVKLDLNTTPGITSQRLGEWAETYGATSVAEQREELLSLLNRGMVLL